MRKYRVLYLIVLLAVLAFLFGFGSIYLLAAEIALLMFPTIFIPLVRAEARELRLESRIRASCSAGSELELLLSIKGSRRFLGIGRIELCLQIENLLLDEIKEQRIHLAAPRKNVAYHLPIDTSLCGELHIRWEKALCFDLLGLIAVPFEKSGQMECVIFPKRVPLTLERGKTSYSHTYGEEYHQMKKGNDVTEMLNLREYQTGDDIRSIHWKLSSKMQKTLVREAGDPAHYDVILLFDAGLQNGDTPCSKQILSAAVELVLTASEELMRLGIRHCIGIPAYGQLYTTGVMEVGGQMQLTRMLLGLRLAEKNGIGLIHFLTQRMEWDFTKMIYITADTYSEELEQISSRMDVTAICVTDTGEQIGLAQKGVSQLFQVPVQQLYERTYSIQI